MLQNTAIEVLLVEDSPGDARLARETLNEVEGLSFRITHVDNLAAALAHLAENAVDVALLDLSLPDAHELEGVRRLQSVYPALPIVVLTGLIDPGMSYNAVEAGAQDFLVKGQGGADVMARAIRYAIERKRNQVELLEAKERAEIANRAKSEFLANMSHELRTPLNAIIGFSEMIRDEVMGPIENEQYKDYAGTVHESGCHLLDIINDILDISKIEAGRVEVNDERIDVAAAISACTRLVEKRAEDGEVALEVDVPDGLPCLRADSRLVKQILLNLLSNAVKFTPAGGHVTVRAKAAPGITIHVADTGIGMMPEDLKRAMTPFTQLDSVFSRKFPGTGLGLPISNSLTDLHGGQLVIESAPGEGTTATVHFPPERNLPASGDGAASAPERAATGTG